MVTDDTESRWHELVRHLSEGDDVQATWVPLVDAAAAAGVSRSTLRAWYRSGQIPSRLEPGPHGPQRMVPRELVVERALQSRGNLDPTPSDRDELREGLAEQLARSGAEREARLERRIADLEERIEALLTRAVAAETELGLWRSGWRPQA